MTGWILLAAVVLAAFYAISLYNRLVALRNASESAWSDIDVQLKRRWDLIPNLVETVKGYAGHERETLESVIAARNKAMQAKDAPPEQRAGPESMLTNALGRLFALAEAYPQLRAAEPFQELQKSLNEEREGFFGNRPEFGQRQPTPGEKARVERLYHQQGSLAELFDDLREAFRRQDEDEPEFPPGEGPGGPGGGEEENR